MKARHLLGYVSAAVFWVVAGNAAVIDYPVTYTTISRSEPVPPTRVVHAPFPPSADRVDGRAAGLVGDGVTDNTEAFRKIFSAPGRNVVIPAGTYITGKFSIPQDTTLTFLKGVTLVDSGHLGLEDPLIRVAGSHVRIFGAGDTTIRANRANYTSGEWRHGIAIYGVSDVIIRDLRVSDQGGDGFYIGGPIGRPATDITIRACASDNNRRQGLSITNARRVEVIKSDFSRTNGTAPQFGIDLEPNHPEDFLDGIALMSVRTFGNKAGGIFIWLLNLNQSSQPVDVTILDHRSWDETPDLQTGGNRQAPGIIRHVSYE